MNENVMAATGHRPDKLGGYEPEAQARVEEYAYVVLPRYKPNLFISGMALGWDQACAKACVRHGIPFIAAVPFAGQEKRWRKEAQEVYQELLSKAQEVVIVCEGGYHPFKMQKRNEWMVDRSYELLALWDGSDGGTANCIRYAKKANVLYFNVWPGWESFQHFIAEKTGE